MLNNRIVLITVLVFFFILLSPGFILTIPPRWSDLKIHKFRRCKKSIGKSKKKENIKYVFLISL